MAFNLQPFEAIELKRIERHGASVAGNDGAGTPNVSRTPPIAIDGRDFTIILRDSLSGLINNGVSGLVKVQVNNSKYIDPNKQGHVINPTYLGMQSVSDDLEALGVFQVEPSTSAADFNSYWIDMPGGPIINIAASGYVGSGAWRYIRLVGTNVTVSVSAAQIPPTLTAFVYHMGCEHTGK
jgi:hypothetical protein